MTLLSKSRMLLPPRDQQIGDGRAPLSRLTSTRRMCEPSGRQAATLVAGGGVGVRAVGQDVAVARQADDLGLATMAVAGVAQAQAEATKLGAQRIALGGRRASLPRPRRNRASAVPSGRAPTNTPPTARWRGDPCGLWSSPSASGGRGIEQQDGPAGPGDVIAQASHCSEARRRLVMPGGRPVAWDRTE